MSRTLRTVIAYILAPAVASLIVAAVGASTRPLGEGPTWIAAFGQYFMVASFASYAISYTIGTVTFLILKKTRREPLRAYTAIGALCGTIYGFVVTSSVEFSIRSLAVVVFFAFISGATAFTFVAIKSYEKKA
jgi:hypothetical protein